MNTPIIEKSEFPNPIHNPKTYQISAFIGNYSTFDAEDLTLYKDLMKALVDREPGLHPTLLVHENNLSKDFAQLDVAEQRKQYRSWAGRLTSLIKPIFLDEQFLCNMCDMMDCNLMDIIYCLYSYHGALLYKQPQFSRWLTTTISQYSPETKKSLGL